jgi:flagella basal body P-ring formation protein FlgA
LALVVLLSVSPCLGGSSAAAGAASYGIPPRLAIERAVEQRIGQDVSVTVSSLSTSVSPTPGLVAVPDTTARSGQPVRFALMAGNTRLGTAVAVVRVQAPHARAVRAIARDEAITPELVEVVDGEVPSVPFRHLPTLSELTGLKARRAIAPGETLTDASVIVPPLVRSGDRVSVTVQLGVVQAQGQGIASGSGQLGDTIHIMQRTSRRMLRARIIGPGAVELIP